MSAPARVAVHRNLAGSSEFAAKVRKLGARRLAEQLDKVGAQGVVYAEEIIQSSFFNDRVGARRKGNGWRHLAGSIRHRIIWNGTDFPVRVELYSLAEPGKVASLEFGADPHEMPAAVIPYTPAAMRGPHGRQGSRGRRSAPYGSPTHQRVALPTISHPGNAPFHFMQHGLERAVQERLARARL